MSNVSIRQCKTPVIHSVSNVSIRQGKTPVIHSFDVCEHVAAAHESTTILHYVLCLGYLFCIITMLIGVNKANTL